MSEPTHHSQFCAFLRLESEAILQTISRLKAEAIDAGMKLLSECRGKVVLVGVGKSGNIAQKLAGTLTSTGTTALYLHPSDAMHGGLGIFSAGDVVIALSNSGETDEIITLLPYLERRGIPVIAIVGSLRSSLARKATVVLDATVEKEACPLNLAPTTSTTVALAIGDAIALTLMQVKGLTEADFAQNHPAGRLGKRLTLLVKDLMHSAKNNPVIHEGAPWLEIVSAISKGGLGAVNVVDDSERLKGIITDGDLRRALERTSHIDLPTLNSSSIMTKEPVVARPDLLAYDALQLMEDRPSQISVLPVVDYEGKCVGLIRLHDIVRIGL
jgi:arabinose-5-phosphate isomerase